MDRMMGEEEEWTRPYGLSASGILAALMVEIHHSRHRELVHLTRSPNDERETAKKKLVS